MSKVRLFNPDSLSPPVGFSHAAGANGFVWLGGQIASDSSGTVLHPGDMSSQFRVAIDNVRRALEASGCEADDVVKITYYVTDLPAYRRALKPIGEAYREVMGKHFPAATLVGVSGLFDPEAMIEIECVAVEGRSTE